MNSYILKTPKPKGNYGPIFHGPYNIEDYYLLPYEFVKLYQQYQGFVTLELDETNSKIINVIPNEKAYNPYSEIVKQLDQISQSEQMIIQLKQELSDSDYKIIKIMESKLLNLEIPYDYEELINFRNQKRAEINQLEEQVLQRDFYEQKLAELNTMYPSETKSKEKEIRKNNN